jgi:hypothetical protein
LLAVTNTTLQNDVMEIFSNRKDTKANRFVQWIRKHVLKPLQQCYDLSRQFINPILPVQNSPRLFTPVRQTALANHTERLISETGKEALIKLYNEPKTASF